MSDEDKPLKEHLTELRKRVIWIALALGTTMIGGFVLAPPALNYLKHVPPADTMLWHAFSPWDGVRLYMQFAFILSLTVTMPFTLYQLWSFVKPGLKEAERRAALRYIPYTFASFVAGLCFGYFIVFPLTLKFTSNVAKSLEITETYGISQYFSFMFNILFPLALLFELPIVILFLTRIRVLNPARLHKLRRYAYMLLLVLSTLVAPPDVLSVLVIAVPLMLLYEISVFLSGVVHRRAAATEAIVWGARRDPA